MNMRNLMPWTRGGELQSRRLEDPGSLLSLHHQMNRLFDDFFRGFDLPFTGQSGWQGGWPHVELEETDKEYKLVAELPGIDEKDIDITMSDDQLTIKGEKKAESGSPENGNRYTERWYGKFQRSFELGPDADPEKVKASFRKGVLTITVGKRPEEKSQVKRIPVSAQSE
jgi:HSP20 family protein